MRAIFGCPFPHGTVSRNPIVLGVVPVVLEWLDMQTPDTIAAGLAGEELAAAVSCAFSNASDHVFRWAVEVDRSLDPDTGERSLAACRQGSSGAAMAVCVACWSPLRCFSVPLFSRFHPQVCLPAGTTVCRMLGPSSLPFNDSLLLPVFSTLGCC